MSAPEFDAPASRVSGGFQISSWSIKNPIPTVVFFILMTFLGIVGFNNMRVNNFPDIDLPYVIVTVVRSGAAPTELENQVTRIVEDAVSGLGDIRNTQSFVNEGASTTMVQFQLGTDLEKATNDVRNAVAGVRGNLPSDITDPIISRVDNVSGQPLVIYTIRAANMSPEELSWYVDNDIAKRVLGVKGVSKVNRNGGVDREIRVEIDAQKLAARGVTAADISQALSSYNVNMPGGRFNAGGSEQTIRTLGNASTVEILSEARIATQRGGSVRLSEVATVTDTWSEPRTRARFNGHEVVAFDVQRMRGSSEVHVEKEVKAVLDQLQAENPNIKLEMVATSVEEVNLSYKESFKALIEGALLAVVVVFLFLRDWRATLVAATAIPMSLLPTFFVMYAINESFNIVSLLALALTIGILVDDAIVEIENIVRHMRAGKKPYQAAIEAADEIGLAVVATTATLIAVFAPTGFMPGIVGQFFKTFAIASCLSVFFSLVVARTLTPLMGAYLLRVKPGQEKMHDEPFWMPTYLRMLDWALSDHIKWRWALVFMAVVIGLPLLIVGLMSSQLGVTALGAVVLLAFAGLSAIAGQKYMKARWALLMVGVVIFLGFVAAAASPYLMAMAPGGTPAAANAWIGGVVILLIGMGVLGLVFYGFGRMKHQLLTAGWGVFVMGTFFFLGSIALVSTIPSDNIPADDMSMSVMSITLPPGTTLSQSEEVVGALTDKLMEQPEVKSVYSITNMNTATITANLVAKKKRKVSQSEFEHKFSEHLHDYPGVHASFGQEGGGGTGASYLFVSDNYEELNRAGIDLMRDLSNLPELSNVHSDDLLVRPELIITPKPEQAALMGVSTMTISQAARVATMGDIDQILAKFNDGDRQVPIRVLFKEDTRTELATLQTLQVPTKYGTSVPLTAVADISFGAGPIQLNRIDRTRSFSVKGDLNGPQGLADVAVANTPTMKAIAEGKYPGVRTRVSPQTEDFAEMIPNFIIAILTGIALMYVVLVLLFSKFSHPFTILMALPVSFGGAFIALIMFGMTLSMPALIGLIMLTGIAAKNSILLVEYAMVSMQHGMSRHDALMDAAHKRARPIIMTTIAMGAGMVPVAIGEDAFRQPMAIAVIGGLITSTLLSLLFIPVMYVLIDRVANFVGQFFKPFFHAQGKEDEEPTPPPSLH